MTSQDGGVNVMRFPRFPARESYHVGLDVCLSIRLWFGVLQANISSNDR